MNYKGRGHAVEDSEDSDSDLELQEEIDNDLEYDRDNGIDNTSASQIPMPIE